MYAVPHLFAQGDEALLVRFADDPSEEAYAWVSSLTKNLQEEPLRDLIDLVPTFTTLTLFFSRPLQGLDRRLVRQRLKWLAVEPVSFGQVIEIPVTYGGEAGPDLEEVARWHQLSVAEVIEIHAGALYDVYMVGFLPGFAYLGGLSGRIHTPRLSVPRVKIPAGAVGIGGAQTGIYPLPSPGGWRLIGSTNVSLWNPSRKDPSLLHRGDRVRFVPKRGAIWGSM